MPPVRRRPRPPHLRQDRRVGLDAPAGSLSLKPRGLYGREDLGVGREPPVLAHVLRRRALHPRPAHHARSIDEEVADMHAEVPLGELVHHDLDLGEVVETVHLVDAIHGVGDRHGGRQLAGRVDPRGRPELRVGAGVQRHEDAVRAMDDPIRVRGQSQLGRPETEEASHRLDGVLDDPEHLDTDRLELHPRAAQLGGVPAAERSGRCSAGERSEQASGPGSPRGRPFPPPTRGEARSRAPFRPAVVAASCYRRNRVMSPPIRWCSARWCSR